MTKIKLVLLILLAPISYANEGCISLTDMFAICEMDKEEQNEYLKERNYFPQRTDYKAEGSTFGNDWYNSEREDYFQILWKKGKFRKVEYRLLDDVECYNSHALLPAALGFKKRSLLVSKYETENLNYDNGEYVLTLVRFPHEPSDKSSSEWYYQVHLAKKDFFDEEYLPWLMQNKKTYEVY